ncbi:MAG: hypothetical protein RL481_1000 [Pseudomonadota bacterium]|jgi:hypothetical protein
MPVFRINKPVVQATPVVTVDVTPADPLPLGLNRFQLVVVDDAGNSSEPAIIQVIVRDTERPTAVLELVDGRGVPIDLSVAFGSSFTLSGARSKDTPPGKISQYQFTLLDRV